ncbi:FAD-binding domain-containing protein [Aspergillus japonicus CBS 114.51]|uniref:FAD-binding domain-containing protein n=1 Tax=Aspergillus japonicus CBS 114.51 TaxID=1448312 RepID=A0A8T8X8H5_ASPJA|nr:FAD-binding domain-containing protein [Aspergillus japonicus CBS 114.51]RAH84361.1 FAD-binding domain-containing protein [Aspergillus japonicus CBS 114.51]
MQFPILITWALVLLSSLGQASPTGCVDGLCPRTRAELTAFQIETELGPLLCNSSSVFGPNDPRWLGATLRYEEYLPPQFTVIAQVGCESDVSTVIQYANRNGIPFYTVNRGHGWPISQGTFRGLGIDLRLLQNVTVNHARQTATVQGGTETQSLIDALWKEGLVTTTSVCACIGHVGPAIGGGHGRYQGQYGMMSDNFVTLNIVLANGSSIVVSSDSHPDLFWSMKGAGHNLGVVTSLEIKVYPPPTKTWYFRNYFYTKDKLESLFQALNNIIGDGTQPLELDFHFGHYEWNPLLSLSDAVIWWSFNFLGPEREAEKYLAPFNNLGPINVVAGAVPYPAMPDATRNGRVSLPCTKGLAKMMSTTGLQIFNVTACRQAYDLFNTYLKEYPGLKPSILLFEANNPAAARAIDPDSSAFPHRDDNSRVVAMIAYLPALRLEEPASQLASGILDAMLDGQPDRVPTTYVNYAFGHGSLESVYGYEEWRLKKLRSVKSEYDPDNKFSYYVPIVPDAKDSA